MCEYLVAEIGAALHILNTNFGVFKRAFIALTMIFVTSQLHLKSTHLSLLKQHPPLIHIIIIIQQNYIIQQWIARSITASLKMHSRLSISSQNSLSCPSVASHSEKRKTHKYKVC